MSKAYETLRDFIEKRMKMNHVYQPVMLKTLIEGGGRATLTGKAKHKLPHPQEKALATVCRDAD